MAGGRRGKTWKVGGGGNGAGPRPEDYGGDFTKKFGPPKNPLEHASSDPPTEESVGILSFATPEAPGFSAIVKHRLSDFNVQEIEPDGTLVRLRCTDVVPPAITSEKEAAKAEAEASSSIPDYEDLLEKEKAVLSRDIFVRLVHVARKYAPGSKSSCDPDDTVTKDVTDMDKTQRRVLHRIVLRLFPHLTSHTDQTGPPKKSIFKVWFRVKKDPGQPLSKTDKRYSSRWPQDRPKYLSFTLFKEGVDQMDAMRMLSKLLRIKSQRFSFAGTKDKRARTTQRVHALYADPAQLNTVIKRFAHILTFLSVYF